MGQRLAVFDDLRGNPRIFKFLGCLLGLSIANTLLTIAIVRVETDSDVSLAAAGFEGTVFLFTYAILALPAGAVVDRFNPRRILLVSCLALAAMHGLVAVLSARHDMVDWVLYMVTGTQAAWIAALVPAVYVIQAGLSQPGARGSAEIARRFQGAVGAAIGSVACLAIHGPLSLFAVAAALYLVAGVGCFVVSRPAVFGAERARALRLAAALREVIMDDALRPAAVADLVMKVVVPTGLFSLLLVAFQAAMLSGQLSLASSTASIAACVVLFRSGIHGLVARRLRWSYGLFSGACLVGSAALTGGWLIGAGPQRMLLWVLAGIAYALPAFGQGLTGAAVQQRVPDSIRGRVSSAVLVPQLALQGLVALVLTQLVTSVNGQMALVVTAMMVVIGVVALRGFTTLDRPAPRPATVSRE